MKNFNDLADFSQPEIADLLALANRLQQNPEPGALQGKVLALLFNPRWSGSEAGHLSFRRTCRFTVSRHAPAS
jgi:ornithine carbamoyltransferase